MKLTRDDLWMTFSEALEAYLCARDDLKSARGRQNQSDIDSAEYRLEEAAAHLDTLTSPPSASA